MPLSRDVLPGIGEWTHFASINPPVTLYWPLHQRPQMRVARLVRNESLPDAGARPRRIAIDPDDMI